MSDNVADKYNVVFDGTIQEGRTRYKVIGALAELFAKERETIEALFDKAPVIIKPEVDHKTAYQFQQQVLQTGANAQLQRIATQEIDPEYSLVPEGEENTPFEELEKRLAEGEEVVCKHCNSIQPLAPYCGNCGAQLIASNLHVPQADAPAQKSNPWLLTFGLMLLVLAAADFSLKYWDIYSLTAVSWSPYVSAALGFVLLVFAKLKR